MLFRSVFKGLVQLAGGSTQWEFVVAVLALSSCLGCVLYFGPFLEFSPLFACRLNLKNFLSLHENAIFKEFAQVLFANIFQASPNVWNRNSHS